MISTIIPQQTPTNLEWLMYIKVKMLYIIINTR